MFAQRSDTGQQPRSTRVDELLQREAQAGMLSAAYYTGFQNKTDQVKNDFLAFLLEAKRQGKTVAAYGAAAKGNTLMNYAGIRPDLILFVVDRNPAKQGKYMPGSRISILAPDAIERHRPDYVFILPWNIAGEVMSQFAHIRSWGGQFVTAVPELTIAAGN